jgi:murein L,D-transpeptidase YafK
MKWILSLIITVGFSTGAYAQKFALSHLMQLDSKYSHHVLVVEKSSHSLHLFSEVQGLPQLVKTYRIATGKHRGNKYIEGDRKTPEGIYTVQEFLSEAVLKQRHGSMANMYGPGAFPLNYPNIMDARSGKTGGGIWIHSTDDDTRIDKGLDSKGCVVLTAQDIKDLSIYIDLYKTPVVIVQDLHYMSEPAWTKNRTEILSSLNNWMNGWKEKKFDQYINQYHQQEFKDSSKGGFQAYKAYKQSVFARPDQPQIQFNYLSIFVTGEYAVATMEQDYRSAIINDVGFKTLYLKKDANYDWKIVAELWHKIPATNETAFIPKQRFFQ